MSEERLKVVHATERYAVIDKPAGLLSVQGKGEDGLDNAAARVRERFPAASGPLVVHRLDMDTSGLLVFGLDADAQRELSMQFEARQVEKLYVALVDGLMAAEMGEIDVPMRADLTNRPVQIVDHEFGKPSLTRWKVTAMETDRTRVELEPMTGRTHQLRVHMAHIGHAILGDVLYGPQPPTRESSPRLCLHAAALGFREPGTGGQFVRFETAVPF
jgi:tRNA pseudouridine32 synthase/23S rRNA pseudouridine746 synthase